MDSSFRSSLYFLGRVTVVHFVTYFIFGIIFSTFLGYQNLFAKPGVACFARQLDNPLLLYGPIVQLMRGPLYGIALLPMYDPFFKDRRGWLPLWGVLVLLQVLVSPSGLIENLIYSSVPAWFWLILLPEVIIQLLTFSILLYLWERKPIRKITLTMVLIFTILLFISILGIIFS